ncbi:MAG: hypothetical protein QW668_05290, partial [Nitrososphaerota archaeon]
ILHVFSVYSLAALFTVPIAAGLVRRFSVKVPDTADPETARLALLFGLLLLAGELVSISLGFWGA